MSHTAAQDRRMQTSRIAGILLILALASLPLFGWIGWDFQSTYWSDVRSGAPSTFYLRSPYPALWLFSVYASLPLTIAALLWYGTNAFGYLFALHRFKGSHLLVALSVPCVWTFVGGQIEGILALGLALAMTGSPLWAGLGITLLSFKPQLGALAIIFVMVKRRDWRIFVIPAGVYLLSLLRWGFWIDDWLNAVSGFANPGLLFPYKLVLLLLLPWIRDLPVWLYVESLVMPYFGYYGIAPILTMSSTRAAASVVVTGWIALALYAFAPPSFHSQYWFMIGVATALVLQIWGVAARRAPRAAPAKPILPFPNR